MMRLTFRTSFVALGLLALSVPASAQSASGTWLRDTGASKVRIGPCGPNLCGSISWLKDPTDKAKVGQRIFYDMKPQDDGTWKGSAFNPEDGKTYSGKMSVSGNTLTTAGCVFGGIICKTVRWSRAN
jgi:uncharacterized protein (DUF2147 family)